MQCENAMFDTEPDSCRVHLSECSSGHLQSLLGTVMGILHVSLLAHMAEASCTVVPVYNTISIMHSS